MPELTKKQFDLIAKFTPTKDLRIIERRYPRSWPGKEQERKSRPSKTTAQSRKRCCYMYIHIQTVFNSFSLRYNRFT